MCPRHGNPEIVLLEMEWSGSLLALFGKFKYWGIWGVAQKNRPVQWAVFKKFPSISLELLLTCEDYASGIVFHLFSIESKVYQSSGWFPIPYNIFKGRK